MVAATAVAAAVVVGTRDPARVDTGAAFVCPMHPDVKAAVPGQCPICGMALEFANRRPSSRLAGRGDMPGMADLTLVENIRKHKIIDFARIRALPSDLREMRGAASVEPDGTIFAIFYDDQIQTLAADEPGTFTPTGAPALTIAVRRVDEPASRWDDSTSRIRFRLQAAAPARPTTGAPEPGQAGWLVLARKAREVLSVPATAVLQSPAGPYVLVPGTGAGFGKRPIEIGETFLKQGIVVVRSGVKAHERVVARAAFFVDADRRVAGGEVEAGWASE